MPKAKKTTKQPLRGHALLLRLHTRARDLDGRSYRLKVLAEDLLDAAKTLALEADELEKRLAELVGDDDD